MLMITSKREFRWNDAMSETRESLRRIYQREESSASKFIPAKPKTDIYGSDRVLRVCAYCRVSTDNDEQLSSFELQQQHYQQLMGSHPNWDLRRIYADEGISGTSLKNRDDFNAMIAACERGEYDLIVTKSVSRFARNLVDCVSLARKLKRQNPPVGVFFETDNLNTLSEESELMLAFLATFAQEESVKKSESMIWSLNHRFKNGKLLTPELLGYERPKDSAGHYIKYGRLEIVEHEAKIVRFIFDAFLAGKSPRDIASLLTDIGCPTKTGADHWSDGSISYILRNERYCGNVLTWKTFTADMFEHKQRRNRMDRDQYLYTDHHDAIISVETFEAAQVLLENRRHHYYGALPTVQVVDDGVFRGYVPINHHWVSCDPNSYYEASNSVGPGGVRKIRKSSFSVFDFDGYQVVRGPFLSCRPECPCITVSGEKISFNVFCMRKFADVKYVQLLLHPSERKLAIRPCDEDYVHTIKWRSDPEQPFYPKTLCCPDFGGALYQIMGWNPDFVYHIRGSWAARANEEIIVFSLANAVPAAHMEYESGDEPGKRKRRVDLCPDEWQDSFGEEFYDYAIDNSFYYLAPKTNWKADSRSVTVPGVSRISVKTEDDLLDSICTLRGMAGNGENG